MKSIDRDRLRDEWMEAVGKLPLEKQVEALERLVVLMATKTRGGTMLRRALKEMNEISLDGAAVALAPFRLKLAAALNAAQDDGALNAAITEAFPRK